MPETFTLNINGEARAVTVEPETPLLYVLRNDCELNGPKYGCGLEQCGACKVLIDGAAVPSCQLEVGHVGNAAIITLEGLGTAENLHPLQEAFLEEQAAQCGFCTAGMIVAAQGLLNRVRYPTDDDIAAAFADNLCRCGTYDRVRRALRLRIGRPVPEPIYEVQTPEPLAIHQSEELPRSLQNQPDLDAWIRINADETVTIFSGKVELGQGLRTALAQIAAEELDVALSRVQVIMGDTGQTPNEGGTTGSMSIEMSGNALRVAAAEARYHLLALAYEHLEAQTPAAQLAVDDATITDPATGRSTTYWTLMGGKRFGQQISGLGQAKAPEQHRIVGQPEPRVDLLGKVTGSAHYVHDLRWSDMLHGRVVRPPGYHARLISVDAAAVNLMPGVEAVIHDGSFLAVVAEREDQAIAAAAALREGARWRYEQSLPNQLALYDNMLQDVAQSHLIVDGNRVEEPVPLIEIPADTAQTLNATYYRPYHMHASIGPSAAAALWKDGQLTVWSHTQVAFNLQESIAQVVGLKPAQVRIIHTEGAGCYGHNGADDAALDAALLALSVPERPVLLKWQRADEHGWEPYSSAMVMQMQASLNQAGAVIDWNHDVYSHTHSGRPRSVRDASGLLAAWHRHDPFPIPPPQPSSGAHSGSHRNADPLYAFARKRVVRHFIPNSPLRVSAMRSLGAYANVFAIESFMDELAEAAQTDPVEFRLRHLQDERAQAVIQAAAAKAGWTARTQPTNDGHGWGIAFAQYKNRQCYTAIAVEVQVDRASGVIRLERVVIAADAGQVVNPDGLSNQLEGGMVQAASWTLLEQVQWNAEGVTSLDWERYPILTMGAAPVIETVILNRPEQPFLGAGEASQNPTPAAIANAVYDAVGVRLREIPFTPQKVLAALTSVE